MNTKQYFWFIFHILTANYRTDVSEMAAKDTTKTNLIKNHATSLICKAQHGANLIFFFKNKFLPSGYNHKTL